MKPKTDKRVTCSECGRLSACKWHQEYEKMGFNNNTIHSCPAFVGS